MSFSVVVLAAGQGTRMSSNKPKALQTLAGKPMLSHVLSEVEKIKPDQTIVIYSPNHMEAIKSVATNFSRTKLVPQKNPLGTGDAVKAAMPNLDKGNDILVLLGDVPMVKAKTLKTLKEGVKNADILVLTTKLEKPTDYGRIKRDEQNNVMAIVEETECNNEEKEINEINSGIIAFSREHFEELLTGLDASNKKGEYYLTDTIEKAHNIGLKVDTLITSNSEAFGVNDKKDLAEAERLKRAELATALMEQGVTICDPARIDIRGTLKCGKDVYIDVNTVFEGDVELSDGVTVRPFSSISNSFIGENTEIKAYSSIDNSRLGSGCIIGPYARLRPGSELKNESRVGNFVEIKNSTIGERSKVPHLTYVGDAKIGTDSNIGAGTITCNYDGASKHKTQIGDNVFIGSGVELVAPILIDDGATIGAGSTISKDVPKGKLTLERAKQKTINGWQRPSKTKDKK